MFTIAVKYVLVNNDGNYIDRDSGVEIDHGFRSFVPNQTYSHLFEHNGSTQLEVEETYTVGAIVPAGYSLYSGESATKNQTLTNEDRNQTVEFMVVASPKYTVTYAPGTHGTFTAQVHDNLLSGDPTPAFVGTATGNSGYYFTGWDTLD